jgi:hypothetical protein
MPVRDDPMSGEDCVTRVYRWKEKEAVTGVIDGANTSFTVAETAVSVLQLNGALLYPDRVESGGTALRDFGVFARKNGVDTRISHTRVSLSGTTLTITAAPTANEADSIHCSYAYTSTDDGVTDFTYYVTDYEPTLGDRDLTTVLVTGGKSYKRSVAQGLCELSLTTIKKDILFSQAVNGNLIHTGTLEISSLRIQSTTGASARTPRVVALVHSDPNNLQNRIIFLFRNALGATGSASGGADAHLEETVMLKCNPEDYGEVTTTASGL